MIMRVLWFEITTPTRYVDDGQVKTGWQDALENIVRGCKEIELLVAFESREKAEVKTIEGGHIYPNGDSIFTCRA